MNHTASRAAARPFTLTIGTPYGVVTVEMIACDEGGSPHFDFRILDSSPLLHTRAAEPFVYRLMNTLTELGWAMWDTFTPPQVTREIELDTYKPKKLVIPATDA